mgnify:CR=1 FL=1
MAPLHMSDAERGVWIEVVNDQPASAFSPTHSPLLANFDRAWMADDDGLKRYDMLLKMAERESRAASSLATRLRITRQAVEHPTTVGRSINSQAKSRKPWELAIDAD